MKKGILIGLAVVLGIGLWLGASIVGYRNKFVVANENINASWAQVENVLQRRADLIPNLVETVKGIAKQEKDVFVQIAEARAKLGGARTINEKIDANNQVGSALSRLLVVVEQYPQLKSNQNFIALQDELAGTENRISVERKRFNESIQTYNSMVKLFPGNIAAKIFNFAARDEYFEAAPEAKAVPKVQF